MEYQAPAPASKTAATIMSWYSAIVATSISNGSSNPWRSSKKLEAREAARRSLSQNGYFLSQNGYG